MSKLIKYYSIVIIFYIIEIFLFDFLKNLNEDHLGLINFILRLSMSLTAAVVIKSLAFQGKRAFYGTFLLLTLINPLLSSTLLLGLIHTTNLYIILAKVIADIFTSLLLYGLLRKILRD